MNLEVVENVTPRPSIAIFSHNNLVRKMLSGVLTDNEIRVEAAFSELRHSPDLDSDCIIVFHITNSLDHILRTLHQITSKFPNAKVLILCPEADEEKMAQCVEGNVFGLLSERHSPEVVVSAVKLISRGLCVLSDGARRAARQSRNDDNMSYDGDQSHVLDALTKKETAVLKELRHGAGNKQIARALSITEATVKVHLRSLYIKTGSENRTQAALWAAKHL